MSVPESFHYVHSRCGQVTEISGPEFQSVANPLSGIETTYCANCEVQDDINQFSWEGSSESIGDYYRGHLKRIPAAALRRADRSAMFKYLIIGGLLGLSAAVLIGLLLGLANFWAGVVVGIIGAVVLIALGVIMGFMHFEKRVVMPVVKQYLKVDDPRSLVTQSM